MRETISETLDELPHQPAGTPSPPEGRDSEEIQVDSYPEDREERGKDVEEEVEQLVREAQSATIPLKPFGDIPVGYVSNARNATSSTDMFPFWTPVERATLAIGSLVRHTVKDPRDVSRRIDTYAIVTGAESLTLGLDDFAIHVYEKDGQPPLDSIQPTPSQRRPVVKYEAKILASNQDVRCPVLSGPVYAVNAKDLAAVHKKQENDWFVRLAANTEPRLNPDFVMLGFYEDQSTGYGILAEERARVLGPKQGHVILSGLPGAGKTSLFLTLVTSLYSQLRELGGVTKNEPDSASSDAGL